jgi:membrane-associated protease RseP (regulator of RpoE activity)
MLGEPPQSQGDLNFALFGIPVRIHPMFWLVGLLLGLNIHDVVGLLIWVAAMFVSILIHEMGHAVVARSYGLRPWVTLYGMGGLTSYNPSSARHPLGTWDQIQLSAAGPGAGFLLAAIIVGAIHFSGYLIERSGPLGLLIEPAYGVTVWNWQFTFFLHCILFISIFWGLINLLPIYPLDGGQIARELLLRFSRDGIRQSLMLSFLVAALMGIFSLVRWHDMYLAIFFAYFAIMNMMTLQAYGGGRW